MRLTKTTGHAIRILLDCATAADERTKVANVADRLGISQLNAFKIVHILAKVGLIDAMRGRNGGIKLAMPASEIMIGVIVRAIEATDVEIAAANGARRRDRASINDVLAEALSAFIGVLDRYSLADLAPAARRPRPSTDGAKRAVTAAKPNAKSAKLAKLAAAKKPVAKSASDLRGKRPEQARRPADGISRRTLASRAGPSKSKLR